MQLWGLHQALELISKPRLNSTDKKQLLQNAGIFSGCLVVKTNLTAYLSEVGELSGMMGKCQEQPRHLIQFFHVCYIAHIPLHNGPDVVVSPYPAPLRPFAPQHLRISANQDGF